MKLRSEYLFCQLMPPAEHQGPAQLTLSNTDNLLLPSFLTPLLNRTHLLPLLLSCRAPSDLSSLFVAHFLRSTPFTAMVFRARSWVIFSLHPSLTLDHLIPSQRNNADNHPLLNSHLQHRPPLGAACPAPHTSMLLSNRIVLGESRLSTVDSPRILK